MIHVHLICWILCNFKVQTKSMSTTDRTLLILYFSISRCVLPRRVFMDMGSQSTVLAVFQNRLDFYLSFIIWNLHIPKTHLAKHAHSEICTFQNGIIPKPARSDTCTFQNRIITKPAHYKICIFQKLCISIPTCKEACIFRCQSIASLTWM